MNTKQEEDKLIYEDKKSKDLSFSVETSDDGKYLMLVESPGTEHVNTVSYADISNSKLDKVIKFTRITEELKGEYGVVQNIGTKFFF